jgi:hypothetical protein
LNQANGGKLEYAEPSKRPLVPMVDSKSELATNSDQSTQNTNTWNLITPTSGLVQRTQRLPPGRLLKEELEKEPFHSKATKVNFLDIRTTEEESTPEEALSSEKTHPGSQGKVLSEEEPSLSSHITSDTMHLPSKRPVTNGAKLTSERRTTPLNSRKKLPGLLIELGADN